MAAKGWEIRYGKFRKLEFKFYTETVSNPIQNSTGGEKMSPLFERHGSISILIRHYL